MGKGKLSGGILLFLACGLIFVGCGDKEKRKALTEAAEAKLLLAKAEADLRRVRSQRDYLSEELDAVKEVRDELAEEAALLVEELDEAVAEAEAAKETVDEFKAQLETRTGQAGTLQNQIDKLNELIAQLELTIEEQQATIEDQQAGIEELGRPADRNATAPGEETEEAVE